MSESNEKQSGFLGTYFDRDGVLHLSRWADVIAWIILTVYFLSWLIAMLTYLAQFYNGLISDKGSTFLDVLNPVLFNFQQMLPGIIYFFSLEAISKGLLIFLDIE